MHTSLWMRTAYSSCCQVGRTWVSLPINTWHRHLHSDYWNTIIHYMWIKIYVLRHFTKTHAFDLVTLREMVHGLVNRGNFFRKFQLNVYFCVTGRDCSKACSGHGDRSWRRHDQEDPRTDQGSCPVQTRWVPYLHVGISSVWLGTTVCSRLARSAWGFPKAHLVLPNSCSFKSQCLVGAVRWFWLRIPLKRGCRWLIQFCICIYVPHLDWTILIISPHTLWFGFSMLIWTWNYKITAQYI